ncbi:MAG: glutathione S-transferase family protein [Candidatus Competibacterales bacterium]|nr:glutathione S-transferase family protein [Candidatus Competibacterales bacterium]
MADYIIYGIPASTYVRTVRMILHEKNQPYRIADVNIFEGEGRSEAHLARHPFGKIPVFQDGELMLYETPAIAEYLEGHHPEPALVPDEVVARARMRQWQCVVDNYGYLNVIGKLVWQRLVNPMLGQPVDEAVVAASLPEVRHLGRLFNEALADSTYLAGDRVSLADLYLAPITAYLALTPEGESLLKELPHYGRWWNNIQERSSFQETPFQ